PRTDASLLQLYLGPAVWREYRLGVGLHEHRHFLEAVTLIAFVGSLPIASEATFSQIRGNLKIVAAGNKIEKPAEQRSERGRLDSLVCAHSRSRWRARRHAGCLHRRPAGVRAARCQADPCRPQAPAEDRPQRYDAGIPDRQDASRLRGPARAPG